MKTNKLFFYLSVLIGLTMGLMACGDDDSDEPQVTTDATALIGSWESVSQEYKNCPNSADNAVNKCGTQDFCFSVTFKSDGTYTEQMTGSGATDSGNYNAQDGIMAICLTYKGCQNWIYAITGNQLQLQQIKSSECSEVITLTKTN